MVCVNAFSFLKENSLKLFIYIYRNNYLAHVSNISVLILSYLKLFLLFPQGRKLYEVKWENGETTWEPAAHFVDKSVLPG